MLIGLTGLKRSGKSTAESYLKELGFETYSFSTPVKETLEFLTGVPYEALDNQSTKEAPLTSGIFSRLDKVITPRLLLTTLGTEWGRNLIHPNIWVELSKDRIDLTKDTVISDVRFQSEVDFIRQNNGVLIHILKERENAFSGTVRLIKYRLGLIHESELGIKPGHDDLVIHNYTTIRSLKYNLKESIELIKQRKPG